MKNNLLLLTGLFSIFCISHAFAQNMDADVVKSWNTHQSGFKTGYCKGVSESVSFVNIGTPVTVFIIGLAKKDKKMRQDAAFMAGAYILSSTITTSAKHIFKAKRPFEKYPEIQQLSSGGGYSFPSGHTSAAFTTAASLCFYYPKWYVIAPACVWASSIALSRIYQGVHYPKDVFAGSIVGIGSALLSYKAQQWLNKKAKRKRK